MLRTELESDSSLQSKIAWPFFFFTIKCSLASSSWEMLSCKHFPFNISWTANVLCVSNQTPNIEVMAFLKGNSFLKIKDAIFVLLVL